MRNQKANEAIYRSPKWMRNFLDYEVATGKDIKGEPSLRAKEKMAKEKAEKEKREREERAERQRREAEEREERRKEEEERQKQEFQDTWNAVVQFIYRNYRECYLSIPERNYIKIECDGLHINHVNLDFVVTFDNTIRMPVFHVNIKYGDKDYDYKVSGLNYTDFKIFILDTIYPFIQSGRAKKRPEKKQSSSSNYQAPPRARRAERPNQQAEKDPIQNRLRRLALLRQTLEGYEATLARTKKGTRDYETLTNEIETIKGRIRAMENARNEGFNHVMSYQLYEKRFDPIKDDYVMITHNLTGEPAPVKILKVYPNNTYLVSFDVEGSVARGAPDATIKNSDIISPYKPIRSPVGSGFISANTNFQVRNTTNVNQVSNDMYL